MKKGERLNLSASTLVEAAHNTEASGGIKDIMPAVHVLREEKGYTWPQVKEWLKAVGIAYHHTYVCTYYRKWLIDNGTKPTAK